MSEPELTAYEKAINDRFGAGFAEMARKYKKETKDYPCGCSNKGNDQWEVCADHADFLTSVLNEAQPAESNPEPAPKERAKE